MITVKEYDQLCKDIIQAIEIDGYIITSTEEQSTKKLQDKAGIQLVAVYPSYSFGGEIDTYKDQHDILFFVVTRQIEGSSNERELQQYSDTQDAMIKLKEYFFGESDTGYCMLFPNVDVSSVMIDPEYNIFGGYIGWSMKFVC